MAPLRGPKSGGTVLTILGQNLDAGSTTSVKMEGGMCEVIRLVPLFKCKSLENFIHVASIKQKTERDLQGAKLGFFLTCTLNFLFLLFVIFSSLRHYSIDSETIPFES